MVHVAELMQARGFKIPLLIGGATTSKRHCAVKIAPRYASGALHVLDASRSCTVVSSLLSDDKQAYLEDIREEYSEIRDEYYATLIDKKWNTIDKARSMRPTVITQQSLMMSELALKLRNYLRRRKECLRGSKKRRF
jgi:5-methyltetrahydrofolate--homocysteine methyltransferase